MCSILVILSIVTCDTTSKLHLISICQGSEQSLLYCTFTGVQEILQGWVHQRHFAIFLQQRNYLRIIKRFSILYSLI